MGTVDSETAYLKRERIHEHLQKIIGRVVSEKPNDAHGLVEVISRLVREAAEVGAAEAAPEADSKADEALIDYVEKVKVLDQAPMDDGNPITVSGVPDFIEEAEEMLAWAGIGFGAVESYKVKCSLRALSHRESEEGYVKIRLWGKILGTEQDYYVAEATKDGAEAEDPESPVEPSGVGANTYTYYVANDLTGNWSKLPNIAPDQIIAARRIKKLMTGDPAAKVVTQPHFPGSEEVLLRAQIARITAETTLCMKGYLVKGEEEDAIVEPDPEFVAPPAPELGKPEGWTHKEPHILLNGRCSHPEAPPEDDSDPDLMKVREKMLAAEEADPLRELNRPLDREAWVLKQVGDLTLFPVPEGPAKSNAITCARSLTWPGAVNVAKGSTWLHFYVGYGVAAGETDFFPSMLPDVQDEPEDVPEEPEPQGSPDTEPTPDDF